MGDTESVTAVIGVETYEAQAVEQSLFERVLGKSFAELQPAIRRVHDVRISKYLEGSATVTRGRGIFAKLIGMAFGFPQSGKDIPTSVSIERNGDHEIWTRQFGNARFTSRISEAPEDRRGSITERFGFLSFDIALDVRLGCLSYPVARARVGGIRLPGFLTPHSDTTESQGAEDGCFHFSVKVDLPIFGHLVSYDGWLVDAVASSEASSEERLPI